MGVQSALIGHLPWWNLCLLSSSWQQIIDFLWSSSQGGLMPKMHLYTVCQQRKTSIACPSGCIGCVLEERQWTPSSRRHGTQTITDCEKLNTGLQASWILCILPLFLQTLGPLFSIETEPLSNGPVPFFSSPGIMPLKLSLVKSAAFQSHDLIGGSWWLQPQCNSL